MFNIGILAVPVANAPIGLLMLLRQHPDGRWNGFGDRLEPDETPYDCFVRSIKAQLPGSPPFNYAHCGTVTISYDAPPTSSSAHLESWLLWIYRVNFRGKVPNVTPHGDEPKPTDVAGWFTLEEATTLTPYGGSGDRMIFEQVYGESSFEAVLEYDRDLSVKSWRQG